LPELEIPQPLELCFYRNVTDAGIEKLAAGCPNLTPLNLSFRRNLTDVGLEKLAVGCPKLTSLWTWTRKLLDCEQVTDVGRAFFHLSVIFA
jgi:hypothetical protein